MAAILFTNAMIMEPAKLMDLASVIMGSSVMTVWVNSQSPKFTIYMSRLVYVIG